jgi:hypothetical protein
MLSKRRQVTLLLLAMALSSACLLACAQESAATTSLTALVQRPSGPVIVTYEDGELTIQAFNTPLTLVLQSVAKQIGATIDVPPGADEPVAGAFGPGSPAAVIAALLNGSRFNYVMTSSGPDPNRLARVVLTVRPAADEHSSQEKTQQANARQNPDSKASSAAGMTEGSIPSVTREQLRAEVDALMAQAGALEASNGENVDTNQSGIRQLQKVMEAALARAGTVVELSEDSGANSAKGVPQTGSVNPENSGVDPAGQTLPTPRPRLRRR